MNGAPFWLAPNDAEHDRAGFKSDSEPLNRYLRETSHSGPSPSRGPLFRGISRRAAHRGLLHLASASVLQSDLPASTDKKVRHYPTVPAIRMGRLAVDQAFKGQSLGDALLADALDRTVRSEIAASALMVDAKDDAAPAFYQHHGFIALPDSPLATVQCS